MFQTKRVLKNQGCNCLRCQCIQATSETGYGKAKYLRSTAVYWKSRVTTAKYVFIPRLEITATTLLIKMSHLIKKELELNDRVQLIRDNSNTNQWHFNVRAKINPVNDA